MDVLKDIYIWLIGIEHSNKFNAVVMRIKILRNPVLRIRTYKDW